MSQREYVSCAGAASEARRIDGASGRSPGSRGRNVDRRPWHPLIRSGGTLAFALSLVAPALPVQQTRRMLPVGDLPRGSVPNFVVILIDDFGVDLVEAYGEDPNPNETPNMDLLAASGVLFRNAWGAPVCSASRSMLMSGWRTRQTGIGYWNAKNSPVAVALSTEFVTIPKMLGSAYQKGCFGKWHLTSTAYAPEEPENFGARHVLDSGFDHHKGVGWSVANGCDTHINPPHRGTYTDFCVFVNGESQDDDGPNHITVYNSTNTTDNAITFIMDSIAAGDPFLAYVAYQAPHSPYHDPPSELLSDDTEDALAADPGNKVLQVRAAVEALDMEIGRLLDTIASSSQSDNTYVFLMGDNGTTADAVRAPFIPTHGKGSMYEGALNIPLIVTGPDVVPRECEALVSVVDIFATLADLSGTPHDDADKPHSTTLVPYLRNGPHLNPRPCIFVEAFQPNYDPTGPIPRDYTRYDQAARNDEYKLIRRLTSQGIKEQFFHLGTTATPDDVFEEVPLNLDALNGTQQAAYDQLKACLPPFPRGGRIRI